MTTDPGPWREAGAVDIGGGHFYTRVTDDDHGEWIGIDEWHRTPGGEWCCGWIPFAGRGTQHSTAWAVESEDPLTITPSLLCRACGSHGWIRAGRWEPA